METLEINTFAFNELQEDIQAKVIAKELDSFLYYWDDSIIQRAKDIGVSITSYDLQAYECGITLRYSYQEIADKIIMEYAEDDSINILSKQFLNTRDLLVEKYSDGVNKSVVAEDKEYEFDLELDELEDDYRNELEGEFCSQLINEYEYKTSYEYAKEMFAEYEFTEDGQIIN